MKSTVQDVLPIIIGITGNNNFQPLAIHKCESASNWKVFLETVKRVFSGWTDNTKPFKFLSDQLVGLDSVNKELFPHSLHKFCMFQIIQLLEIKFKKRIFLNWCIKH